MIDYSKSNLNQNNSQSNVDPEMLRKILSPDQEHLAHQLQISHQSKERIGDIKIKDQQKSEDAILAVIAYLWVLVLIPLISDGMSDFTRYHGRQGLRLAIFITVWMFVWWLLFYYLSFGIWIIWAVNALILYWIISGIIHVVNQEQKPLFLLGVGTKK